LTLTLTLTLGYNMEGTPPNAYNYGGHPAPSGRALPNLLMQSVF